MHDMPARMLLASAALSLLALGGCNQIDPLTRPYVWHPTGANMSNISAMAANPADLIQGREDRVRRVRTDADAVDRVWSGKTLPLPGGSSGGGAGGGGGGGAAGGGGP
jgi:type IV pilus biogenesis protein CpaD/CtpE